MRERIAFQTNVPVTVALAYADGLQVQGRFGDQIMYTLADERVMYVPPVVRSKLVELGIQPSEPFTICKAERKEGNRRFIEWQVRKENNADDLPPSETPPVNGQTNGLGAPKPSNGHAAVSPCSRRSRRASMRRSPPSSTQPRKASPSASEAKTCAPWRSACSSRA